MAGRPYISDNTLHLDGLGLDSPTIQDINQTIATLTSALASKQNTLVSGTNIKTINGESILGSGDLVVVGGSGDGIGASYWTNNPEYLYCIVDAEMRLLWGIREDGSIVSASHDEYEDVIPCRDIHHFNKRENVEYILSKLHNKLYNENKNTHDIVSFLWFSDMHGDKENLERISSFYNTYKEYFDDVISSGDQITSKISDDWSWWNMANAIFCLGNHEVWKNGTDKDNNAATPKECYDRYYANIREWGVTQPTGASANGLCYFHKDYIGKFRLIVLDQMHWDSSQATWFANTLTSAKNANLTVIVMGHYACGDHSKFNYIDSSFTTIELRSLGTTNNTSVENGWKEQESILTDWISNGGKFAVWLCGHTHDDYIGLSEKGIPCVVMEQSSWERSNSDCRTKGTKSQDSFNAISIDAYNKMFYIARIGNDVDKMMRSKKFLCFDYTNKKVISNS